MTAFDVSVVIPTYNRATAVVRAVSSCRQDGVRVEAIVVDDGSTDDTAAALRRSAGPGLMAGDGAPSTVAADDAWIRFVSQNRAGPAAARNVGLRRAQGEFVKFLDSDDWLLPGALAQEVACARQTGADAVLTGWEEYAGNTLLRHKTAPDLSRGVDDMLLGRAPWTAAALYRSAFVRDLYWRAEDGKADDWGWAWTVCLAGAHFARLELASAVYVAHDDVRVSQDGDTFQRSTDVRQRILGRVERALANAGSLTPDRRQALARYYYVDAKPICERSRAEWETMWRHCRELAPDFAPRDADPMTRVLTRCMGVRRGIATFVALRRVARALGLRRHL